MISITPQWQQYSNVSQLEEGKKYLMIIKPLGSYTPFEAVNQNGWYIPFVVKRSGLEIWDTTTGDIVRVKNPRVYFAPIDNEWEADLLEGMTCGTGDRGSVLYVISKPHYDEDDSSNERGDTSGDTTERVSQSEEVQPKVQAQEG